MTQSSSSAADGHDRMIDSGCHRIVRALTLLVLATGLTAALARNTGQSKLEAGLPDTASSVIPENPAIPMGGPLPVDHLQPGSYVIELRASDSAGQASVARKAEFTLE